MCGELDRVEGGIALGGADREEGLGRGAVGGEALLLVRQAAREDLPLLARPASVRARGGRRVARRASGATPITRCARARAAST